VKSHHIVPFCARLGTISLQLQWWQVHFNHSGYHTTHVHERCHVAGKRHV